MLENSYDNENNSDYDTEFNIEPEDELLMHTYETLPKNCKKYWKKRYDLFSKFDNGIYMTSELWYSVTPEEVAIFTAKLIASLIPEATSVLDICCGGGGNTIQFAKYFGNVGAIDINPANSQCTKHNASIYGVEDKIWSYVGDWRAMSNSDHNGIPNMSWIPPDMHKKDPTKTFDFIFCSPPWGGPSYKKRGVDFDLESMEPLSLRELVELIMKYTRNFGLFLPRTLNLDQLRNLTNDVFGRDGTCRVIYVNQRGFCIGLIALFGKKVTKTEPDYTYLLPKEQEDSY